MSAENLEIVGHQIVLLGSFDPSVGQPKNLFEKGLFRQSDLEEMKIESLFADLTSITLSWMAFSIEVNRVVVSTTGQSPLVEPVLDFTLGLIDDMKNASISSFGVNEDRHFQVKDAATFQAIGHRLAPKDFLWNKLASDAGMLDVTIQGKRLDDEFAGYIRMTVQPSLRVPNGIFVQINDHFDGKSEETLKNPKRLLEVLEQKAPQCFKRSAEIISQIRALQDG